MDDLKNLVVKEMYFKTSIFKKTDKNLLKYLFKFRFFINFAFFEVKPTSFVMLH